MEAICKNCKFWNREKLELKNPEVRICKRTVEFWEATEWDYDSDDCDRVAKNYIIEHKAFTQDGSDYKSLLLTTPDFGCNQFEKQ